MLIVKVNEGINLEKALKQFKRKFQLTGIVKELRDREQFTKPSMKRRNAVKKAKYIQKIKDKEENY